jgi:hypothetical protein
MRPGVMEENHIVHENPRALFPDGSSQTCECATIAVRVDGGTSWREIQQEWSSEIPEDCDQDFVSILKRLTKPTKPTSPNVNRNVRIHPLPN